MNDPRSISNTFNEYFANIGKNLTISIPNVQQSPIDYLNHSIFNNFFIFPTTSDEIEKEISCLKLGKSSGFFSVPTEILKILKTVVSKPLEIIYNTSFTTGIVPEDFKLANVIRVFKSGLQTSVCNCRSISQLCALNKILEKLMYKRLLSFINKHSILYEKQFGFRTGHSTDHTIMCIIDKIQKAIDNKSLACGIFLDFSKAFDTVDHQIRGSELEYYGIRGIARDWVVSNFTNRKQVVFVDR